MRLYTLAEWLERIEKVHNKEIELGLDRIKEVAHKLGILRPRCPVVIVGGTNGKGSTIAGLATLYQLSGYRVGTFTSPVLFKHNEYVSINGELASDDDFCQAYEAIEVARGETSLTSFEFHSLAAFWLFNRAELNVWLLEVGLGGRLDAVNIMDADVAVVTSISLDHTEWLGETREAIGFEKAGIFRSNRLAVCGDSNPPQSLIDHAEKIGAILVCQGKSFYYQEDPVSWSWSCMNDHAQYDQLPKPHLHIKNMSTVLMTITLLQKRLPVTLAVIEKGMAEVRLPGRIEIINDPIMKIFDVSHNAASVALLADRLKNISCIGETHAVFSMLADKALADSIAAIKPHIDYWHVAQIQHTRTQRADILEKTLEDQGVLNKTLYSSIEQAFKTAILKAKLGDRIVVFGSFHVVAEVRRYLGESGLNAQGTSGHIDIV